MSKIRDAFTNGKAFIPFITAGDPDLNTTKELVLAMEKAGADLIEIGIPFSDPVAEGTTIQKSSLRALKSGVNIDKIFDMLKDLRKQTNVPLVFMTYINPIFKYGKERFMKNCVECDICGIIVPDLPFEEKGEIQGCCDEHNIELVSLIAPTSKERIKTIAKEAQGFVYCVSSMGVTGVRQEITTDIDEMVSLVREVKDIPCAIGFGIATEDQAICMAQKADGVIVGSAIVSMVEQFGTESIAPIYAYVKMMKDAIATIE